jgi:DNA-binding NarL/FixJ family response regulator
MLNQVRIVVADRDSAFRKGLSELLAERDGFDVIAELQSGRETVLAVRDLEPDLMLLDMRLPDMSGLDVLRQVGNADGLHTIVVSDSEDTQEMTQALLLGAKGGVERSSRAPVLFKCIRAVLAGELWFRRDITKALLRYVERSEERQLSADELADRLTRRENDVLRAVANGMPNREIATKLQISEYTVKHHLSRIFAKLSVSNRVELALLAARYDL